MLARKKTWIGAGAIVWLFLFVLLNRKYQTSFLFTKVFAIQNTKRPALEAYIKSWKLLEKELATYSPNCEPPERLGSAPAIGYNATAETPVADFLKMPIEDIEAMKHSHTGFIRAIQFDSSKLVYARGTRGIVTTAGGYYLPVMVISLRMLRRTGSTLPVEVFLMAESEYEKDICDIVLPAMNAKCIVLSEIIDAIPHSVNIVQYQLKIFAMIFSTFEEILLLDADSFPLQDPEVVFKSELFQETGMITWPDFWHSTASQIYYTISSQTRPSTTLRASSESGEMFVSKRTHSETLMLAAYYNYYGPTHYYTLLSQGGPGEGDKETFLSAAMASGQSFYAVSERVNKIGHWNPDKHKVEGSAMVQYDPRDDYNLTKHGIFRAKDPSSAPPIKAFFVHANFPKVNPSTIFKEEGRTHDADGNDIRLWTESRETVQGLGFDVERRLWEEIQWTACELEGKFQDWKGEADICTNVVRYRHNVFGGE